MADYSRLSRLPAPLLEWYRANRRILPLAGGPPALSGVGIREIMLQRPVWRLCCPIMSGSCGASGYSGSGAAPEEQLLKLWEGLGYYSRVRNLQKAARVVCEQYGGELPGDYEAVKALPGIGEYTAGAICSIAFGLPTPAVDGNVLRVVCRITGDETRWIPRRSSGGAGRNWRRSIRRGQPGTSPRRSWSWGRWSACPAERPGAGSVRPGSSVPPAPPGIRNACQ